MKKTIFTSISTGILLAVMSLILTSCGGKPKEDSPLVTPHKIEGLQVGTCQELVADMRKNDKKTSDDELYRAAAVILSGAGRLDEANSCCDSIKDDADKLKCKK